MWNIDEFLSGLNIDLDRLRDVFTYDPQAPMIFSSGIFLWLFVAFILVYLLLQRRTTARLLFVTLFSYYFYYKSSGTYFFLLGLATVHIYRIAQRLKSEKRDAHRKENIHCRERASRQRGKSFAQEIGVLEVTQQSQIDEQTQHNPCLT